MIYLYTVKKDYVIQDFEQTCVYLAKQIQQCVSNEPYYLVGYSLGGRIALYFALAVKVDKGNLQGLILEGANSGLVNEQEKQARWQNDQIWAQRFRTELPQQVLKDWYHQPVFSHLNTQQRTELIAKRSENFGENIAQMLLATSLAKQPDFSQQIHHTRFPIYYLVGKRDQKFYQTAVKNSLVFQTIANAGHNAHLENPLGFKLALENILNMQ